MGRDWARPRAIPPFQGPPTLISFAAEESEVRAYGGQAEVQVYRHVIGHTALAMPGVGGARCEDVYGVTAGGAGSSWISRQTGAFHVEEGMMGEWQDEAIRAGAIVALTAAMLVAVQVLASWGTRLVPRLKEATEDRRQQLVTMVQLAKWMANILIIVTALLMLLTTFGVNITPVLASAGVAGLAISLGAQSLIQDFIGGLLIVLENQFAVGDVVEVGGVSGEVEQLTLRATHLRSVEGDLQIVPNGQLGVVTNRSREWSRALVDLGVAYEEDVERAQKVLEESAAAFAQNEAWVSDLIEPPQVLGVHSLGDWAVVLRITVKTRPGRQFQVGRQLRQHLLAACEREGVTLPYPRQEVWLRSLQADGV